MPQSAIADYLVVARSRCRGLLPGLAGSPGIGIGTSVVLHPIANLESVPERPASDITVELTLLERAVEAVRNDIRGIIEEFKNSLPQEELALFDAYLHMLDDNALAGDVRERVLLGQWAQGALKQVIREHVGRFELMDDPYPKRARQRCKRPRCAHSWISATHPREENPISKRHHFSRRRSDPLYADQYSSGSLVRCRIRAGIW